ncbi:MAG: hypothetical protein IJA59_00850 [Clostridia bacterium]|nr:hypothetical protein [Clostridia bacterium]
MKQWQRIYPKLARFCRSKNGETNRTSLQSGSPDGETVQGLRSKLKKGLETWGKLAFLNDSKPFFNELPQQERRQQPQRLVLCYFLDSRK